VPEFNFAGHPESLHTTKLPRHPVAVKAINSHCRPHKRNASRTVLRHSGAISHQLPASGCPSGRVQTLTAGHTTASCRHQFLAEYSQFSCRVLFEVLPERCWTSGTHFTPVPASAIAHLEGCYPMIPGHTMLCKTWLLAGGLAILTAGSTNTKNASDSCWALWHPFSRGAASTVPISSSTP
jgi:hypothetical protein